jgi:hypothetical protein
MSTLTSASTLEEVQAAYYDNADYDAVGSVTKAKDFIVACRYLILHLPRNINTAGSGVSPNVIDVRSEMQRAQTWLASNDTTRAVGGVKSYSFKGFR